MYIQYIHYNRKQSSGPDNDSGPELNKDRLNIIICDRTGMDQSRESLVTGPNWNGPKWFIRKITEKDRSGQVQTGPSELYCGEQMRPKKYPKL